MPDALNLRLAIASHWEADVQWAMRWMDLDRAAAEAEVEKYRVRPAPIDAGREGDHAE